MFELTIDEFEVLRTQFATSKRVGTRYVPMVFTEQGIAMLSSVLNSKKAIQINIEIMRAFATSRKMLIESKDLLRELRALDDRVNQIFNFLLRKIDALSQRHFDQTRKKIGFKRKDEE